MKERIYRRATPEGLRRRRQEIAVLWLYEGYTIEEISQYSVYCERTVGRDIEYIKSHPDEFMWLD